MRVLLITPNLPRFPGTGSSIRTFCLLRELAALHEFYVLVAAREGVQATADLEARCRLVRLVPADANGAVRCGRAWSRLLGPPRRQVELLRFREGFLRAAADLPRPDLIHVEDSLTAILLQGALPEVPRVVDAYDLVHRFYLQSARRQGSLRARGRELVEWAKVRQTEARSFRGAAHCLAVSRHEAEAIRRMAPRTPVTMVENGVDTGYFTPLPGSEPGALVFTGKMDFDPNDEAARLMIGEILPAIRRDRPEARFHVVGMNPLPQLLEQARGREDVEIHGAVPDVRPHLARASVVVVPLRAGTGTRLKILEALAAGRAVVSTRKGAEGLEVEEGRHLLLADEPEEFARRVVDLLGDEAGRRRLGEEGRRLVAERYDWRALAPKLDRAYREATGRA